ncbi:unnamed protein product [Symbiodinium natans]|uniref:Uncharacterized protein n=1 Tax=Symbiodinium natans TaxID=878477 RepID=A0A812TY43_9DINO|nr:unnamed protein product [Symbiodinium natans]
MAGEGDEERFNLQEGHGTDLGRALRLLWHGAAASILELSGCLDTEPRSLCIKAAEEREAFLQALMQDRAEAGRGATEFPSAAESWHLACVCLWSLWRGRVPEAKRAETLRRLEATNRAVRAQFEQLVSTDDFKEAKVQFLAGVEEIPMEGPHAGSAAASSNVSMTGHVKKPILKGAGERKHVAACRGQACGDETPNSNSSDDSVYPEYDGDDDFVCFEE